MVSEVRALCFSLPHSEELDRCHARARQIENSHHGQNRVAGIVNGSARASQCVNASAALNSRTSTS